MTFETISLLLNWVQLGVLLAMLLRLGRTFELIANTQRELRRAIHHLGDRRVTELGSAGAFAGPGTAYFSRYSRSPAATGSRTETDDLAQQSP
jgi:hypothetical protein